MGRRSRERGKKKKDELGRGRRELVRRIAIEAHADGGDAASERVKAGRAAALGEVRGGRSIADSSLPREDMLRVLTDMIGLQITAESMHWAGDRHGGRPVSLDEVPALVQGVQKHGAEWFEEQVVIRPNALLVCMSSRVVAASGRLADEAWREVLGLEKWA